MISLCCVSTLTLLGNGSVIMFLRQRIHVTIEELLDAVFSVRAVLYEVLTEREVDD
jgi:hypothetical protein